MRKMTKKILWSMFCLVVGLALIVAINTFRQGSRQLQVPLIPVLAINENASAQRLAVGLRAQTISSQEPGAFAAAGFMQLHAHLQSAFPRVHAALQRETVGQASLLFRWPGSDAQAKPILLMAHQDVVPIAPQTEHLWLHPPFAGEIVDGFIWGRGAWDDKANLFAMMEAVESLLASGFTPRQTIYLAFGHDEEIGGSGAREIAALLQQRGVKLEFVLDEGLLITEGILAGLDPSAALIGVAEKGYTTAALSLETAGGHSSLPPPKTAIGMMSVALAQLENRPFPAEIKGVSRAMFDTIAPEMKGLNRVLLSNLWLFGPLVQSQLEKSTSTNAMLRTTTALTTVHAGNKDNVVPGRIDATVNFRTLPGETEASVLAHVRNRIANEQIKATLVPGGSFPSKVSSTESAAYYKLNKTIREVFANTIVAPGLMLGATDSRHFEGISEHIFKFSPVRAGENDLPRFHGTNERIAIKNYAEMIRFYHQLVINHQGTKQAASFKGEAK